MDLPIDTFCQTCSTQTGLREFIFEGIDTLPQFCNWILGDENKGVTCIAHNFGGYDCQFILHYILEYGTVKPEVIMNGNTILRMKVGRVTLLDSYQFLHMRLANFPDTFGLTEMKKVTFLILQIHWQTKSMWDLTFLWTCTILVRCLSRIVRCF